MKLFERLLGLISMVKGVQKTGPGRRGVANHNAYEKMKKNKIKKIL